MSVFWWNLYWIGWFVWMATIVWLHMMNRWAVSDTNALFKRIKVIPSPEARLACFKEMLAVPYRKHIWYRATFRDPKVLYGENIRGIWDVTEPDLRRRAF